MKSKMVWLGVLMVCSFLVASFAMDAGSGQENCDRREHGPKDCGIMGHDGETGGTGRQSQGI
jgi:hypothetical protein